MKYTFMYFRQSNDAKIALEMQKEEILEKERDRIKREMEDQVRLHCIFKNKV